jgi:hypothetical protein
MAVRGKVREHEALVQRPHLPPTTQNHEDGLADVPVLLAAVRVRDLEMQVWAMSVFSGSAGLGDDSILWKCRIGRCQYSLEVQDWAMSVFSGSAGLGDVSILWKCRFGRCQYSLEVQGWAMSVYSLEAVRDLEV